MWKRFLSDRSGNLAILGALAIVPVLGIAGLAIDVSHALTMKTEMQAAADAAVVGSIADKSAGVVQALMTGSNGEVSLSEADARAIFKAQFPVPDIDAEKTDQNLSVRKISVKVVKNGHDINAHLSYSVNVPTTFLNIFGKTSLEVAGEANAVYTANSFMDFYMLLDNTPSMGVGATPADVDKLIVATKSVADAGSRDCAFACHIVSDSGVVDTSSNYFIARSVGATIRIDVVAKAVAALTSVAEKTETYVNQYRMAAYTFGKTAKDAKLLEVSPMTDDLTDVSAKTGDIQLMSIPYNGYNNDQTTSFDDALSRMNKEIDKPGDGSSAAAPEKIVYFVSDGVGDSYKPSACKKKVTGGRCQEPIDIEYCQKIKDRGIKLAVLYTTYLPLTNNGWYNTWIKPFQSEIGARMEACASPGLYFEVSPSQGIEAAMNALFVKIIRSPRLSS